jgi:hypothetical protein
MEERRVEVDHSSLNRWVLKYAPLLDQAFRARKRRTVVAGEWTRPTTGSGAIGSICIGPSTRQGTLTMGGRGELPPQSSVQYAAFATHRAV